MFGRRSTTSNTVNNPFGTSGTSNSLLGDHLPNTNPNSTPAPQYATGAPVAFSTPAPTVLPNSVPTPAPVPTPGANPNSSSITQTQTPTRIVDPNLNSEQQSILDDLFINNLGWTEAFQREMLGVYYSLWGKTIPTTFTIITAETTVLPNSVPNSAPASDQYSISNQLQQGMNALMQGEELPPFSQPPPPPGPNFLEDYTPILEELPSYTSREELMENYAIPDDSWTGDMADREDNIFQGLADVFDPNRNGVADAFDPNQNGVADFFNQLTQPEEEEEKSSMNLLLLGAGALILVYALM